MLDDVLALTSGNLKVVEIPHLPADTILVGSELFKRMQEPPTSPASSEVTAWSRALCRMGIHDGKPCGTPYVHVCDRPGCGARIYLGP